MRCAFSAWYKTTAEGPSTQDSLTLVPNTIKSMVFGARDLKYWVLGPSGNKKQERNRKAKFPANGPQMGCCWSDQRVATESPRRDAQPTHVVLEGDVSYIT